MQPRDRDRDPDPKPAFQNSHQSTLLSRHAPTHPTLDNNLALEVTRASIRSCTPKTSILGFNPETLLNCPSEMDIKDRNLLPSLATPVRYELKLIPHFSTSTFDGLVTITLVP